MSTSAMIRYQLILSVLLICLVCSSNAQVRKVPAGFVSVHNRAFQIDGKPYYYLGTNFWYGMNLGSKGAGGNRARLVRELDRLAGMGVRNLRVVAGSEGPDTEPWRIHPALQTASGKYNKDVLEGLDVLLNEMKKRQMKAVMCLNDFWPWSGGMGQYLVWAGAASAIPYPPPQPNGDWGKYAEFTARFYSNAKAMGMFNKHIEFIVNRVNSVSKIAYKNDPTIMAWELANEPRGVNNIPDFLKWLDATAGLIKRLDPNHLVTTGSEGKTSDERSSGTNLKNDHSSKYIDYATIHIWVQNWGVYDPARADQTYQPSVDYAVNYIKDQLTIAKELNKPLVLEEFGISRDLNSHDAASPTTVRDRYYAKIFETVFDLANKKDNDLAGVNFWAWAGEGRPRVPQGFWKTGDDLIGDPPHEAQGWYSVFDTDANTINVIRTYAKKMDGIGK